MRDPNPPRPGYVTTRQAAKLYGCSTKNISRVMPREGVTPVATPRPNGRGTMHWWDPSAVLKVRAVRAARFATRKALFGLAAKHPTTIRARVLLSRESFLERERRKYLARVAAREGITVEALLARNATAAKK